MFKDKLKELREKNKISQYELSTIIHVSRAAISKWESGKGMPSECTRVSVCEYFKAYNILDKVDIVMEEVVIE